MKTHFFSKHHTGHSSARMPILFISLFMLTGFSPVFAQAADPHLLYEQRCAGCHTPHAGEFVHDNLIRSDNKVIARKSHQSLRTIFEAGHGKLTRQEIDIIIDHLTAIHHSGRLFHDKCLIYHNQAVIFARARLDFRNNRLIGRYSKRDIGKFLLSHGRLKDSELSTMIEVLKRQLGVAKK